MAGSNIEDLDAPLAEINVTPLVDVMLVLLVIFIVAAPLMAQALKVDLPRADAPADGEPRVLTLIAHAEGKILLDGEAVTLEELSQRLAERRQEDPETVLRLGADASTPYQAIARLLSIAQQSGIGRIAFATRPAGANPAEKK